MQKFYQKYKTQLWTVLTCLLFAVFFIYGYSWTKPVELHNNPPVKEPAPLQIPREYSPNDSLLDLKLQRDRERSREVEKVEEILDKIGLSDDVRKQAEEELWRLTQATAKEHELENLLKAKGFNETLVTISQKLVSIIVAKQLQVDEVRVIGALAMDVTSFNIDQIQIVEK